MMLSAARSNDEGNSKLIQLCLSGDPARVNEFLKFNPKVPVSDLFDSLQVSCLHLACHKGNLELTRLIYEYLVSLNLKVKDLPISGPAYYNSHIEPLASKSWFRFFMRSTAPGVEETFNWINSTGFVC